MKPVLTSRNEKFLKRLDSIIELHLSDESFGVKTLSQKMQLSDTTLWRKVRQLTHLSPQEYIRITRLQHAGLMLEKDAGSVSEIADAVGFGNKSYFSKCFQERFGVAPSLYRSKHSIEKKDQKILSHSDWKTYKDN